VLVFPQATENITQHPDQILHGTSKQYRLLVIEFSRLKDRQGFPQGM